MNSFVFLFATFCHWQYLPSLVDAELSSRLAAYITSLCLYKLGTSCKHKLVGTVSPLIYRVCMRHYWGEPERALHKRVCCGNLSIHIVRRIYIVHRAVSHFRLLFCTFLHISVSQKLFTNNSARRHKLSTSSMATARAKTTRGPG